MHAFLKRSKLKYKPFELFEILDYLVLLNALSKAEEPCYNAT
jgi:hypothetical protein